jgi:phage gp16-like protein
MASSAARKKSLAALHLGKKQLGLEDEQYRDVLCQVTGKLSAADCTDAELGLVLDFMRTRGFSRRPGSAAPVKRDNDASNPAAPQLAKIHELWDELAAAGAITEPTAAALRAFGKRVTGKQALEFMTTPDRSKVIEGLKSWLKRASAKPNASVRGAE